MMVPRSYHVLRQQSPPASPSSSSSPPRRQSERIPRRRPRASSPSCSNAEKPQIRPLQKATYSDTMREADTRPAPPTSTPTVHSKPVVIPPRTPTKSSTTTQTVRVRGHHGARHSRGPKGHNHDAIPPAVATLLAVTEIPRLPTRRLKGSAKSRRISMDELIQEWNRDEPEPSPSAVGSPLDLLLGRVDESDDEYGSLQSMEHDDSITSRSTSSESITTMPPSLSLTALSYSSNWDNLSTPDSYTRPERREKQVQSPPTEDCVLDHPLLHFSQEDCDDVANFAMSDVDTSTQTPLAGRFQSFKSNLTASFQAVKSAAKSFSNFTAPSVPPDDLLSRSLLSPRFASEMRPKQLQGVPSPALRRYLNPQPPPISAAELSMQLHAALSLDIDTETHAPMIQMQTYDRRSRSSPRKRKNDPFSEAGRAIPQSPAVRQREPRENGDFLRVIVLEMNMRRVGKLDAKAVGKARIWLPPRRPASGTIPVLQSQGRNSVPDRWVSTLADDGD